MKTKSEKLILVSGLAQILIQAYFASPGGDISLARNAFKQGERSDLFGTFASEFYARIPHSPFGWSANLAFLQCCLVFFAIYLFTKSWKNKKERFFIPILIQTIILSFASQQSRDGTAFSFIIFGIAILFMSRKIQQLRLSSQGLLLVSGTVLIILGLAFRPWMSVCILPIISLLRTSRSEKPPLRYNIGICLLGSAILVLPLIIELSSAPLLKVKHQYPFQLVIIHDLSATACWSANIATSEKALSALKPLSTDANFSTNLCQFFKPNTWQSVAISGSSSTLTHGNSAPLAITESKQVFDSLFDDWIDIIIRDPKTYLQNKLMISSQVLFASQTKVYEPLERQSSNALIHESVQIVKFLYLLFNLPWLAISKLYLMTPGAYLLIFVLSLRSFSNAMLAERVQGLLVVLFSTLIATLLFVSDNARYTTPFVIIGFLLMGGFLNSRENSFD
jgi:hypothetical protein